VPAAAAVMAVCAFGASADGRADEGTGDAWWKEAFIAVKPYTLAGYAYGLQLDFVLLNDEGGIQALDACIGIEEFKVDLPRKFALTFDVGFGYSYGYGWRFEHDLGLYVGASVGVWLGEKIKILTVLDKNDEITDGAADVEYYIDFFGPFVRFHVKSIEFMFRLRMGLDEGMHVNTEDNPVELKHKERGFGMRQQISIGYCFGKAWK
jgi:hypothetical protein